MNKTKLLLERFFEENSLVASDINSFNHFVDIGIQKVIDENKELEPPILPANIDDLKIRLDKVWLTKPEVIEADGSKREILPIEARLRKLTYAAPIMLSISAHINGVQRESFTTQIASMPVMLKSKKCFLHGLNRDELIDKGEDPDDPGGYFIINGTEKVLISVEDLMPNNFLVEQEAVSGNFIGKIFSEHGAFKIPHTITKKKDGIFYISFTRVKEVPLVVLLKALGLIKDEDIVKAISTDEQFDEVLVNLYEFVNIKTKEDAIDYVSKKVNITQPKIVRMERTREMLDRYLLPHIGITEDFQIEKAYNLCKVLKKYIYVAQGKLPKDDKDHYKNKKLKLSGELLMDLFRANLRILIGDMLYNFQRIVKRGKMPSIRVIIREKLLTSRIYSSMATGSWVGGRKGISQRLSRINFLDMLSHLQRVVSPLSSSQENFQARELHPTHLGRLCPAETPEGTNIGLRKNLSLLSQISQDGNEEELVTQLTALGLKGVKNE
ncbi:DNA-directed RNA polymerase subunit B'' [Candidatus Woesearchaeota archaeon]|jgi:DNA-directed RNA polymerase subunit B|nr:DNA-directed RNA polymerase subunit B'' [Candidatus Woesearchaeota archaeon]MBT3304744.1 DNA-directed RNA polymerase subunit B'' [Candidatus Woesearchaeota archaeon]MBT4367920.1 DNA-directed RNA polymerase subunit B'' [Candidatus Woesearchaeota archaeon]MBT4712408.1 DNA-directed RNA polymerase subunit B'' [Candidatus Woesearchaeota archaeon]MBT6639320.1 DNA-directed RNA polymerase subunit B'' [Candidatus Woesearchaeota archaeon]